MKNNFEGEILEKLKNFRVEYSKKRPPSYKLRECLSFCTKRQLTDIAFEHGVYIAMSKLKSEIVDIVEELLISRIEGDFLYLEAKERDMIVRYINNRGIVDNELMDKDTAGLIKLKGLGYIFWFYHEEDFYAICPDEIANLVMNINLKDNKHMINRNNKIFDYLKALQNIYGVFEVEQLLTVWNKYNKDKLDLWEAHNLLNMAGKRQNYFWWDPPYIISDYFMDDIEYREYLELRSNVDYYIPSKQELYYYKENEFDKNNIYYKRMLNFLEKSGQLDFYALENLIITIEVVSTIDGSLQEIVNEMNEEGFSFGDLDQLNKFTQLFMNLSNSTRKWTIKGHKPDELAKREQLLPLNKNRIDNVIPFPQGRPKKAKKIGRNQPCPCGSGKKYKFCCGK